MKKQFVATLFSILTTFTLSAQVQSDILNNYINQALESNLALQQKELSYEKSLAALQEAKSMFLPKLSLEARYTMARGGRSINFPVGDLLNSVYGNLNVLNEVNSQNPDFPEIEKYPTVPNQTIDFLRTREHETMFRVLFPVFNAAIIHNNKIQNDLSQVERISVDIYKKELREEGKTVFEAAKEAGEVRFIPILMTTLTTILGLLPLTLSGGSMWAPMGWTIIGGLLSSTFFVLLLVPVLYQLFTKEEKLETT